MTNNTNNRSVFLCFRPVAVVEEESSNHHYFDEDDHLHQDLSYIKIGEKQQRKQGSFDQEMDDKSPKSTKPKRTMGWLQRGGCRRRSAHRIISKIAKAVMFDTELTKRIRSRKVRQDPTHSSTSNPILTEEEERIDQSPQSSFSRSSSSLTTLTTSSSLKLNRSSSCLSSSTTSNSFRTSEPNQTVESRTTRITRRSRNYSGWYLVVVSLVSVILFGRFLAVLWTATWLFLIPSRRGGCGTEDNRTVEAKLSSADRELSLSRDRVNSRRVVMDGFLERNNNNSRRVS
ncbi:hypothetical protein Sjap_003550 [Stephania japonica]|uniref:Transmembrane protein n=1 Tax=Stephania japonica TaxID=461633 RepID=A0AAP0PV60_9MAGN